MPVVTYKHSSVPLIEQIYEAQTAINQEPNPAGFASIDAHQNIQFL